MTTTDLATMQCALAGASGRAQGRRVGPWIDDHEFRPRQRPALRLPPPGGELQALHDTPWVQRLVAVLDERLRAAVERPVVVHPAAHTHASGTECRTLVVLFSAVVQIEHRRVQFSAFADTAPADRPWREDGLPPGADEVHPQVFSVWPSPYADLWMHRYLEGAAHWLQLPAHGFDPGLAQRYVSWLGQQMLRRHWAPQQRRRVRALVAAAYDLDPEVLALALRAQPRIRSRPWVSAHMYNRVLDDLSAWREVARVAPTLLPLYALAARELTPGVDALKALRAWVLEDTRLAPRHWRWMQRHGTRWIWLLMACAIIPWRRPAQDLLAFVAAFEFDGPASPAMLRAVMHLHANPNARSYLAPGWAHGRAVAPLAAWWRSTPAGERPELAAEASALARWLQDEVSDDMAAAWARRSWRRAVIEMRRHAAQLERAALDRGARWSVPIAIGGLTRGALRLQVLGSTAELLAEGHAMRHCVAQYGPDCQNGKAVILSIRRTDNHRRVATAMLCREEEDWRIAQVAGFANASADSSAIALAQQACVRLEASQLPDGGSR